MQQVLRKALSIQVTHSCSLSIHAAEGRVVVAAAVEGMQPIYLPSTCFTAAALLIPATVHFCCRANGTFAVGFVCRRIKLRRVAVEGGVGGGGRGVDSTLMRLELRRNVAHLNWCSTF